MTTTVLRFPKHSGTFWRRCDGLSLECIGDAVTVSADSSVFEFESTAKSLALLLFETPATLTWSEQDEASLAALFAIVYKHYRRGRSGLSVGLGRAVLTGQINPRDVINQLQTRCKSYNPKTKEKVKGGEPVLITSKSTEDMVRVLKYLGGHDYLVKLSVTVPRRSVPRTLKVVDVTSLTNLNLSDNKLVQEIEDWNDFVLGKLSRFPNLGYLEMDENGLGRNACDALARMLSQDNCSLHSLHLNSNKLDDGCVEVLASSLLANKKLGDLALTGNYQITSQGPLLRLLGERDTPTSTYNSNYTLINCELGLIEGSFKTLLKINRTWKRQVHTARQKIWYVHYKRAKQFDVGPFLGLEVGVMPHLLDWFGVTQDRKRGTRFEEKIFKKTPFDDVQKRFNIFYQLIRNWNVATLLGQLSPDRARNLELEGQFARKDEEIASMGEEIRALKSEIARLKKENQDLSSGNVSSKRKRVS